MSLLGVYIHIPFCLSKCPYCGFNSSVASSLPEDEYVKSLLSEIKSVSREHFSDQREVDTIYFGGGTPSLFSPGSVEKIIDGVANYYCFSDKIEITLEANPGTLSSSKLEGLFNVGINRLNLGFQSLQDRLLKRLGRIHSAQDAYKTFYLAREVGFKNLGVDLIFSIPGQETDKLREDLERVVELKPEHIAAYNLTCEPHTLFSRRVDQGTIALPSEEREIEMYGLTHRILTNSGYNHYEISNFALPGYHSRHNQKYWNLTPYMGVGAGAHSYKRPSGSWGMRWWNISDPYRYLKAFKRGKGGVAGEERLNEREALKEAIFLGLRQLKGINLSDFRSNLGTSLNEAYPGVITSLVDLGLLNLAQDNLRLTSRGILLADEVFQSFF